MQELWQAWTSAVSAELCDQIIEEAKKQPIQNSTIGFDDAHTENTYRSSKIHWLNPIHYTGIRDLLWRFAAQANRNSFQFDINYINDIQYAEYHASEGGKYDWHHDVWWNNPQPFDRKISLVIQLSNPEDYEGGEFEFGQEFPQVPKEVFLPRGSVLAFPSFIQHRVTPVTKGMRRSLVSWVEGPKFR